MTPFRSPWPDVPLREVAITDRLFEGLVQAPDAVVLIAAFLRCELTCSKQPLRIDCNEAVPKSASGKILRLVSKDQVLKQTGQNGAGPGRPRETLSPARSPKGEGGAGGTAERTSLRLGEGMGERRHRTVRFRAMIAPL